MKNLLLIIVIVFTLISCDKDDDKPKTELEKLPQATQTGAQTFGCLIDGKAFLPPKFGTNAPRAFYQLINGSYTLGISGSRGGGANLQSINIGCLDMPVITLTTFNLKEFAYGNYFGEYFIGGGITFSGATTSEKPGNLTITRFDPANFIISGTFEFTVLDDNGVEIKITDGRFDMRYTN
tara:strand:+ start:1582 stop:2121 length:540 start_codon:yes stop_codon:yes gene_type:complete